MELDEAAELVRITFTDMPKDLKAMILGDMIAHDEDITEMLEIFNGR